MIEGFFYASLSLLNYSFLVLPKSHSGNAQE